MKKFAANYLVTNNGIFLKNGIAVATDEGEVVEFIDQGDDLREIAQLTFFNGILITNYTFVRSHSDKDGRLPVTPLDSLIVELVTDLKEITIQNVIETGIQIQVKFPEMTIPQILNEITNNLLIDDRFYRIQVPGIFLLNRVNLSDLKFTNQSRLKKIH